ncbi:MAG: alkaline phosphatase family protein [Candidatus Hydrothermarchaeales archaeon]
MLLVIGLDAATWKVIEPNIDVLPNLKRLMEEGKHRTIIVKGKPHSASVWCSIFSGKTQDEHKHYNFIIDGKLQTRGDIKVDFIWDILDNDLDIRVLGVPFVYPPYNFNCHYEPIGYGLSWDLGELGEDMEGLSRVAKDNLSERPDVFIVIYTMLDKIQHFHWGEAMVIDWYKKIDGKVGELLEFTNERDKIIVLSDHGFCDWDEVEVHTLPPETPEGEIKGDHHPEAILITKNVDCDIEKPEDIFFAIKEEVKG